jgi:KipI family sensor histidine kinase inhibitor
MNMYKRARYLVVGDRGVSVEFGNAMDEEINLRVQKLWFSLKAVKLRGIIDAFPTIRSLFVYYNPLEIRVHKLIRELKHIESELGEIILPPSRLFDVPCLYGGEFGPDLDVISNILHLSPEEIIQVHSGKEYLIYATGAVGGSAHFKVPPPLDSLPRKKTPNLGVPIGAVQVAGGMGSAFKPIAGPTGWYWIGTAPLRQWFPEKDPPLLIRAGDKLIYRPVNRQEFFDIKKLVDQDQYDPIIPTGHKQKKDFEFGTANREENT